MPSTRNPALVRGTRTKKPRKGPEPRGRLPRGDGHERADQGSILSSDVVDGLSVANGAAARSFRADRDGSRASRSRRQYCPLRLRERGEVPMHGG